MTRVIEVPGGFSEKKVLFTRRKDFHRVYCPQSKFRFEYHQTFTATSPTPFISSLWAADEQKVDGRLAMVKVASDGRAAVFRPDLYLPVT